MSKSKVALFDFCETLVSLQTADDFVKFVITKKNLYFRLVKFYSYNSRVYNRLARFVPALHSLKKFYILNLLRGLDSNVLEELAVEYADLLREKFLISQVYDELISLKASGYTICVVSAGYSIYISKFLPNIVDVIISNDFEIHNTRFTGRLNKPDCICNEKVARLEEFFLGKDIEYSIGYSDSITDLPMLELCSTGVVVSHKKAQSWAKELNFHEIVYI